MSHYFHYLLMALAVSLNIKDRAALALSLIVGLSAVLPVLMFVNTAVQFYAFCAVVEILVAVCALWLRTTASRYIVTACLTLIAYHFLGWHLDGYPVHSPYHLLVKIAEYAELFACVLLSKPILGLIRHATYRPR